MRALSRSGLADACLPAAQTAGVDGGEANSIARQSDSRKELAHFGHAEDDGQLLLRRRAHNVEGGPFFLQGVLKEELEPTDGNGHGVAGVVFDIQEILAQFFLADQVR